MHCITTPIASGDTISFGAFLSYYFTYVTPGQAGNPTAISEWIDANKNVVYYQMLYTQAVLESGYFKSNIFMNTSNMFGMKAPNSRRLYCKSVNYSDGDFAAYNSIGTGIADRIGWDTQKSDFILPQTVSDSQAYFDYVAKHGYATDPNYSIKLVELYHTLINKNYFFDTVWSDDGGSDNILVSPPKSFNFMYILFPILSWFLYKKFKK